MRVVCPTCKGNGELEAIPVNDSAVPSKNSRNGTCHCDGPSHTYSPGWCPKSGPV